MTVRATVAGALLSTRRRLLLVLLIAAAVRVLFLVHGDAVVALHGDENYYVRQGASIAQGSGHPGSFRPPLYSLLIGASFFLFGEDPTSVRWIQIVLSLAAVGLLYAVCRERFGPRAAALSALACALSPALAHFTHFLWSETLFVTLFLLFLWLIRRFDHGERFGYLAGAAVALALAALTKEIAVFFAVLMLPWFVLRGERRWRSGTRHALIFLACFLLPLIPWTVRNSAVHGTFVGLSNCRWFPIATGNLRAEDALRGSTEHEEFIAHWRRMTDEVEKEAFSRRAALRSSMLLSKRGACEGRDGVALLAGTGPGLASAAPNRSPVRKSRRACAGPMRRTTYGLMTAGRIPSRPSLNASSKSPQAATTPRPKIMP